MDFLTSTVTAAELGDVLNLTDRRIRQLAEEGVFERAGRGRYPLAGSVQAYIAAQETDESDELRREKIALMRAQRRRIELDNLVREGTEADLDFQDIFIGTISTWWFLHIRPIATWLFEDLRRRGVKDDHLIAGEVQAWLIALRHEGDLMMLGAAGKARKQGIVIDGYDTLVRMIGGESRTDNESADEGEPPTRRQTKKAKA
ncbi:hypothetical protein X735_12575 [Mesorhizobium sp. L2C085B000]|nr:hypothetical protein X735_12575 [Mesorhizobium sp. L2C085B000]